MNYILLLSFKQNVIIIPSECKCLNEPVSASPYRFGFGGQEADNEMHGDANTYTADYWEYDARLGRRWNVDPVVKPWESSYAAFGNNPIYYNDPNGADAKGPGDILAWIKAHLPHGKKQKVKKGKFASKFGHYFTWRRSFAKINKELKKIREGLGGFFRNIWDFIINIHIHFEDEEVLVNRTKKFKDDKVVHGTTVPAWGATSRTFNYPALTIGTGMLDKNGTTLNGFISGLPVGEPYTLSRLRILAKENDGGGISDYTISVDGSQVNLNYFYNARIASYNLTSVVTASMVQYANNDVFDISS